MTRIGLPVAAARPVAGLLGRLALGGDVPVEAQRRRLDLAAGALPAPRSVRVARATLGGVPCERHTAADPGPALLYLHGGAYRAGSPRSHRSSVGNLVARLGGTAWVLDYRLAPEHPYPAALDDALAAYRALVAEGAHERIMVAGDSAGGGLAMALAMALRDAGDRAPDALGLISPWLDLDADVRGLRAPAPREVLLDPAFTAAGAREYSAGHDARDPLISPLYGDVAGLPPIVVSSGGDDLLLPDAEQLERRAREAGARLVHHRYPGFWHDFHAFAATVPRAAAAVDDLAASMLAEAEVSAVA